LGDLDVSPLPFCVPRPSCVAEVLRLTSADLTVLTYDGRRLDGPLVLRGPVVIADLPRGVVLELPASSTVEVRPPHHVKSCANDTCQILDLRGAEVRFSEAVPPS
jgi:hypothetical protein